MAILRSADGKFYDIPDQQLEQFEVPAGQVKGMLGGAGSGQGPGSGPGPNQGPGGEVQPYGNCPPWRNCFRNCFNQRPPRNCSQFRNCAGA